MKLTHLLLAGFLLSGIGCSKVEPGDNQTLHGKLIGYLKCTDKVTKSTLIGVFIISNNRDSVLSFNVPFSISKLDTSNIDYGVNFFDGDSISFKFRKAENAEVKQYDYPPSTMQKPTFYPIEDFTQVIIANVGKIQ